MLNRIIIFGATGSGKTTLAKKLSNIMHLPHYSTDNFVYKRIGREKYAELQTERNLKIVARKNKWIIEGVHRGEWIIPAVKRADIIIILRVNRLTLYKRVILRYLKKEKGHYETIGDLGRMLHWAHIYKNDNYIHHVRFINEFKKEYMILKNKSEINNFLHSLI